MLSVHVLLLVVFGHLPLTLSVTCNAYDTCFLLDKRLEMQEAVHTQDKEKACSLVASALRCLDEAEKDCDASENVPGVIRYAIQHRRANITSYCASSGAGRLRANGTRVTMWTTFWTLWIVATTSAPSSLAAMLFRLQQRLATTS